MKIKGMFVFSKNAHSKPGTWTDPGGLQTASGASPVKVEACEQNTGFRTGRTLMKYQTGPDQRFLQKALG